VGGKGGVIFVAEGDGGWIIFREFLGCQRNARYELRGKRNQYDCASQLCQKPAPSVAGSLCSS
jgi:hypothetical protein